MLKLFSKVLFILAITIFSTNLFAEVAVNIAEDKMKTNELKVERVELYPSFADIYFSLDFSNKTTVTIPSTFEADTFTVDYNRSKGLTSVDISTININATIPKYLKSDFDKINKINDELIQLRAELNAYQSAANLTDRTNFNVTDLKMLETLTKAVIKNKIEYVKKAELIRNEIMSKESDLKRLQSDLQSKLPQNYTKALSITLAGGSNSKVYFKMQTNHVSWGNRYSFDLNSTSGEIKVKHFINITQISGYDWSGDIIIHTTNRSNYNYYSRLKPEIVDFERDNINEPRAMMSRSESKYQAEAIMNEEADQFALSDFEVSSNIAEIAYNIKADIKSETKSSLIPLDSFSVNSKPEFILTPLLNSYAMIIAKIEELPKYIFYGEAVLNVDNIFMGRAQVENHYIGSEWLLSFGYSNLITAERKDIITKENAGILKSSSESGYDIIIKNNSNMIKEVKVTDRIPYSANDGIKVKDIKITPKYTEESNGVIDWKLTLNKGESKQITVRYKLDYPKDKKITIRN